ncbi:sulfotransferase [Fretibacter rubidus]|uniref:tetratricopeptide repeat-containing sulfotransferase family protein n=1 Tax=Fretibacter rubidus TaxID=570162 RepID=UPI00352A6416
MSNLPSESDLNPLQTLLTQGNFDAASTAAHELHHRFPQFVPVIKLGLQIALRRNDGAAATHYAKAWRTLPALSATDAFNLGHALKGAELYRDSVLAYERAIQIGVSNPHEAYNNKGVIEADFLLDAKTAAKSFTRAIALQPDDIAAYLNRGNIYEEFGDFDAAIDNYETAVVHCHRPYEALARLAHCIEIDSATHELFGRLHDAADDTKATPFERESLLFALGHKYDSLGDYSAAFDAFSRANKTGSALPYNRAAETAKFEAIKAAFPPSVFKLAPDTTGQDHGHKPIFICGMFRSGSTLFEQIISGSGDVTACGEIGFFDALVRRPDFALPRGQAIGSEALAGWRKRYHENPLINAVTTPFFTDKRPDNFLYLGLIKQMFPKAKIVVTQRAARDNALSLFFTQFGDGQAYARDLEDIAHYQDLFTDLMAHWQACFGHDIVTADYDSFIAAPEVEGQAIMDCLDLDFTPDCLAFHNRKNRVKTASYKQVRQKLYTSSSGRADNYAFAFKD